MYRTDFVFFGSVLICDKCDTMFCFCLSKIPPQKEALISYNVLSYQYDWLYWSFIMCQLVYTTLHCLFDKVIVNSK